MQTISRSPIAWPRTTRARTPSGTFPVSRGYHLRQMLYNPASAPRYPSTDSSQISSPALPTHLNPEPDTSAVLPVFPFGDVPIYADTLDLQGELVPYLFFFLGQWTRRPGFHQSRASTRRYS